MQIATYNYFCKGINDRHSCAPRFYAAMQGVSTTLLGPIDALVGSCAGILSILTGGNFRSLNKFASFELSSAGQTLPHLFVSLSRTINPRWRGWGKTRPDGHGIVAVWLAARHGKATEAVERSGNGFIPRLFYLGRIPLMVLGRAVDGLIGLASAFGSLVTFGQFELLNRLAFDGLTFGRIFKDLHYSLLGVVNPSAEGRGWHC